MNFLLPDDISEFSCGVLRGSFDDCLQYAPYVSDVIESTNLDLKDYEVDVKLHMLMAGQYSCIGGWHCDFIPRKQGVLDYSDESLYEDEGMFIWVSGEPTPIFLSEDFNVSGSVGSHVDLDRKIQESKVSKLKLKPEKWYQFSRLSPHIGTVCTENSWRVFIRLTHRDLVPENNIENHNRRHAQVYLPQGFSY
ncbi:hypothetical protein N9043_00550 [bacterium]|nr:hypothetical protein [bacterium]